MSMGWPLQINPIDIDIFLRKSFDDATDSKNLIYDKQAEDLNSKSTYLDKDENLNVEAQTGY